MAKELNKNRQVDVLMTVRNGAPYLGKAIESVIGQTFKDWHLIVVDDGSTDATPAILEEYVARDSRIQVLVGKQRGIAAAANIGLSQARAPLVARLDADDLALPDRLRRQKKFMDENPAVVALGSYVQLIDKSDRRMGLRRVPTNPKEIRSTLRTRNCIYHPSSIIRLEDLINHGGYREQFQNAEDYDLWLRLSGSGELANEGDVLTLYRKHSDQITSRRNAGRLTFYSVAAALDDFTRTYLPTKREVFLDEKAPDSLAQTLLELYKIQPSLSDTKAINRHAMRLLRFVPTLSPTARHTLLQMMIPRLSAMERLRLWSYSLLRKTRY